MPVQLSYPGVYIQEVPSGVRTITGVATSITAFIGRAYRGPVNDPVRVQSFAEYERIFGPLWQPSPMSHAVAQFFQHGGSDALIVRVFNGNVATESATMSFTAGAGTFELTASSPGVWGTRLRAIVDHASEPANAVTFNLTVQELDAPSGTTVVSTESFRNVSVDPTSSRFVDSVVAAGSALVNVSTSAPVDADPQAGTVDASTTQTDGSDITDSEITGNQAQREGIFALEAADLFNLLCIPPLSPTADVAEATWAAAASYCESRRAMLIVDPPATWTANPTTAISTAEAGVNSLRAAVGNATARNAAAYFPQLLAPDALDEGRVRPFAPCGAVAGLYSRTDANRGVWKAPAGLDASFSGVTGFSYTMTDAQNGVLNPIGLNCFRSFPVNGNVVWGARTLAGADQLASEWKYVPVRRTALFIEESLYRGTQWVVFEPNDEPLWAQIRLNVGAFMQTLFRQGAFQGSSPREAYFVKCDRETTTQNDINLGIVNILVGFAPLKPAEFVVIKLQQMAGQVEA
ncbi:MAG: phage tail sheath subtilisin-like domain-containing protein [Kiloniellales bacterium]